MKLSGLFNEFFNSEKAGGIILLVCAILSIALANSPINLFYTGIWQTNFAGEHLDHWINDGLMAIFFC